MSPRHRQFRTLSFEQLGRRVLLDGSSVLSGGDEANLVDDHVSPPHPDDAVKQAEHLAVLDLVPYEQVTHRAVSSGPWTAATTWASGVVPTNGARVLVGEGVIVTVDKEVPHRLRTLRIDGRLQFAPHVDTSLHVDTIVVAPQGILEIGTEAAPIRGDVQARVVFTDAGPIDPTWDPLRFSRGLISHGQVGIHGAAKSGHAILAQVAKAGATSLLVADSPAGWSVGDRILVPGVVRPLENYKNVTLIDEDEIVSIVAISVDGRTIKLDRPLRYNHVPPRSDLTLPVANLDRNVIFQSENTTDPTRAGHVMFMHNPSVSIEYAAFRHVGRNSKSIPTTDPALDANGRIVPGTDKNPRGRYAVHFHRTGDTVPAMVKGSVVEKNPGWGFVNHGSNVLFEDNVSYDVKGAGFVTEIGNELGLFRNNFAIRSRGAHFQQLAGSDKGEENGFGSAGHGFWMQSPGVELIDNIAAGHAQEGIFLNGFQVTEPGRTEGTAFKLEHLPAGAVLPTSPHWYEGDAIVPQKVPFHTVSGNTVFASGTGIGIRWHRRPEARLDGSGGDLIEDFKIWNVKWSGIQLGYTGGLIFRNGIIIGNVNNPVALDAREQSDPNFWADLPPGKGIIANVNSHDLRFENLQIEGFTVGIQALRQGNTIIDRVGLRNVENIRILTAQATQSHGGRRIYMTNVTSTPLGASSSTATQYDVRIVKQIDRIVSGVDGDLQLEFKSIIDVDEMYYNGRRLYFHDQAAGAAPFPTEEVPEYMLGPDFQKYLDKTNQQLFDEFGIALGGSLAPASAIDHTSDGIYGLADAGAAIAAPETPVEMRLDDVRLGQSKIGLTWTSIGVSVDAPLSVVLLSRDGVWATISRPDGSDFSVVASPDDENGKYVWNFDSDVERDIPAGTYAVLVCLADEGLCAFMTTVSV